MKIYIAFGWGKGAAMPGAPSMTVRSPAQHLKHCLLQTPGTCHLPPFICLLSAEGTITGIQGKTEYQGINVQRAVLQERLIAVERWILQLSYPWGGLTLTHVLHHTYQSSLVRLRSCCTEVTGHASFPSFPCLTFHSLPSICWWASQVSHLHLDPCFKVCCWGNANKLRWHVDMMWK